MCLCSFSQWLELPYSSWIPRGVLQEGVSGTCTAPSDSALAVTHPLQVGHQGQPRCKGQWASARPLCVENGRQGRSCCCRFCKMQSVGETPRGLLQHPEEGTLAGCRLPALEAEEILITNQSPPTTIVSRSGGLGVDPCLPQKTPGPQPSNRTDPRI